MKKLDLTNQKFGMLTVIKPAEPYIKPNGKKISQWLCECACGKKTIVRTEFLRNGHTTSCGCICGRTDIVGKRYGKLTVLEKLKGGLHLCQCNCGNKIEVLTYNLKNGNTQSCGCLKSKGELKINQLLNQLKYEYSTQYTFPDLIFPDTKRKAYFDFAILQNKQLKCLIEYDGQQHYYGWAGDFKSLQEIQKRDEIKNIYCKENHIKLIRIKYDEYNTLTKEKLEELINE